MVNLLVVIEKTFSIKISLIVQWVQARIQNLTTWLC